MPLVAGWSSSTGATIPGVPEPNGKKPPTNVALVGPSYFETMQIPILRGRSIEDRDQTGQVASVVVNEVFANKYFPGRDPVGERFTLGGNKNATPTQIVGVSRNSRYASLKRDIPPVTYVTWTQPPSLWRAGGMFFALRTVGDPMQIANAVRQLVHQADANIPVADLTTQARQIDETIVSERTFTDLCACFGILALTIAAIGLYGTMAYAVARRTGEIGLRLALGAQRPRVLWMVLREATLMLIAGVAIGVSIAWWTSRFLASFLFGVKPNDLASIVVSVAVLAGATVLAGYLPAWRASRIDPMTALRHE
jgi:predicted permease